MSKYILNIDADEILYNAAFAVEKTAYKIKIISSNKEYDFGTKYSRGEIISHFKNENKLIKRDFELETYKVAIGPPTFAMACAKNILKRLRHLGTIKLWLTSTDKSNFRYEIARTNGPKGKGYKAGRPNKPIYYNEVREYLIKWHEAEEVFGIEADDALGINQTDSTVAIHIDKDINRIQGKHLNWKTLERYKVEGFGDLKIVKKATSRKLIGGGNKWFFAQLLLGDRVDNIPSIIGHESLVKAFNLLESCNNEKDAISTVLNEFHNVYDDNYAILYELADLLYIMDSAKIRGSEYIESLL